MNSEKSERELLTEISKKLDRVFGALIMQNDEYDENAKVKILYDLGLDPGSIALILGLSKSAVMVRMSRIRGKATKSKRK